MPNISTSSGLFDLSTTPIASDYPHCYLKVIDDVFTPEECASFIALAESDHTWQPAMVSTLAGDRLNLQFRNSSRILRFDHNAADHIHQRLLQYVQELVHIKPGDEWESIVASPGRPFSPYKLVGVNERLSFLRYGPGHYFKSHCDGMLQLPDGRRSRVTIQIYLNDDGLSGGSTRIHGGGRRYLDVEPKIGRVLIFQQKDVYHSGEEVVKGLKYALRTDFMFKVSD